MTMILYQAPTSMPSYYYYIFQFAAILKVPFWCGIQPLLSDQNYFEKYYPSEQKYFSSSDFKNFDLFIT